MANRVQDEESKEFIMDILVNNLKVISNGSIVINVKQSISFKIGTMTFVFDFPDDGREEKDVKQERTENTMITHLINFNNPLGSGLKEPTMMATLATGEKLLLNFSVDALSEVKVFHYTWFIEPIQDESHE